MAVNPNNKVFVVNEDVNTQYGGVDPTGEFVAVSELASGPAYKVYTALLTQSGGSVLPERLVDGDAVELGVTYLIDTTVKPPRPWDFSNVGGPKFPFANPFVATASEVPNNYGDTYLSYNTSAPIVTVLENTIGNVWFTYNDDGNYNVNSDNLFTSQKNWCIQAIVADGHTDYTGQMRNADESTFYVITTEGAAFVNDILTDTPIEIRVYN